MEILLTGSGCPGWYSAYKTLSKEHRVIGCDCQKFEHLTKQFVVPPGDAPTYLTAIEMLIELQGIDLIVPLTDPELVPLSTLPNVMVSDAEELEKVLDKQILYTNLSDISPKFYPPHEFYPKKGWFLKSSRGHGSRGTKKIVSDEAWLEAFHNMKPEAFGSIFPENKVLCLANTNLMLVEPLPGPEYSIDCVYDKEGELYFYGVREREQTRNGISQVARFIVDKDGEYHEFIKKINNYATFKYNINIQAKRDNKGELKLLEINPRISGSIGAFKSVGYDLVHIALECYQDRPVHVKELITPREYERARTIRVSTFV